MSLLGTDINLVCFETISWDHQDYKQIHSKMEEGNIKLLLGLNNDFDEVQEFAEQAITIPP